MRWPAAMIVACAAIAAIEAIAAALAAAAASAGEGVYEDPLGRYRFSFAGTWRVGADEEDRKSVV